ncbi:hypothetical protein DNK56_31755 [Streptomyces sp. AC1-42W]|nr:hypothetical protein DNK56_31755 [Streptomyces sp. AC1-42W]
MQDRAARLRRVVPVPARLIDGHTTQEWERAKDARGEFGSTVADNSLTGPGQVTRTKGEYFKTNRCAEWKRTG